MAILSTIALWWWKSGYELDLQTLKNFRLHWQNQFQISPITYGLLYFFAYILITALSLPIANIVSLAGSAIMGFLPSLFIISFASTLGACAAFLISRFLLREFLEQRFPNQLKAINEGIEKQGGTYLASMRLFPFFPFFLINSLMGLTQINLKKYYWVSQLSMLPGTAVYAYAGTQLGKLNSLEDIYSPQLIFAFVLLAAFPILAKKLISK